MSMCVQSACIVWFKNMNFIKVLQHSLIVFQHPFNISMHAQSACIIWFKNMSFVKVLQGSLIIFQHLLDIPCILRMKPLFSWRTLRFQGSSRLLDSFATSFSDMHMCWKRLHCLVKEHEPCISPSKFLDINIHLTFSCFLKVNMLFGSRTWMLPKFSKALWI